MKIDNPVYFRNEMRKRFDIFLGDKTKSVNMEIGAYNHTLKEATTRKVVRKWDNDHFVQLYVDRLRTIYTNLKNPTILEQLHTNAFSAQTFASMSHHEMLPEKWDARIKKKIERDRTKYDTQIEAATDTFTCRKCKSNKCTYYQMQTRSADEPMTSFVSCIDCGARWKC
jgi:transcription elongation factor S-II